MNKRGEILIRHLIFGAIVLSLLSFSGLSLITEIIKNNPSMSTDQVGKFNDSFNKYADIVSEEDDIETTVSEESVGIEDDSGDFGPTASLLKQTWTYVRTTFASIGFVKEIFTDGLADSGIPFPFWVSALIGALITFLIGFIILSILWRGKI